MQATALGEENVAAFSLAEVGVGKIASLVELFMQKGDPAIVGQMEDVASQSKEEFGSLGDQSNRLFRYIDDAVAGAKLIVASRTVAGLNENEGLKGALRLSVKTVEAKLGEVAAADPSVSLTPSWSRC